MKNFSLKNMVKKASRCTTMETVNWIFFCGLAFCMGCIVVLSLMPIGPDCVCPVSRPRIVPTINPPKDIPQSVTDPLAKHHRLALLVPFRDRFEELLQFVPHMTNFLNKQHIVHHIFVLNQIDRYRFNRASLINVGYKFTHEVYDYIAMHDVDLLPMNDGLLYDYPSKQGPLHIAAPQYHPKYHYETFVGGILLIRREHFAAVNGMSNKYWGWGLEDDEFYVRLKDAGLQVERPTNIDTGSNDTFSHIHNRYHRKRDTQKCFNQKEVTRKRDRRTGLNTLDYKITKIHDMSVDHIPITILNIELHCNMEETPWCDCSGSAAAAAAPPL